MNKQELLHAIKGELKRKGLTAAEVSERAVGNTALIANMSRERYGMPSTENLQALCDVLGWEFYVGPPRETGPVEQLSLRGKEYAHIPLHNALLAAGPGVTNNPEEIIDHLAFRRDWLNSLGVPASSARLVYVHGDSMRPTIWPGDLVMIDTRSRPSTVKRKDGRDSRRSPIYAIIDNGEARMKRIERPADDVLLLVSDNPDYAPELRQGAEVENIQIIGKVVWWGHRARD